MKVLITGHRLYKLQCYDIDWIKLAIEEVITKLPISVGLSGMASGVDLWYCESLLEKNIPYFACPPFEEQEDTLDAEEKILRKYLLDKAVSILSIRNSKMLDRSDAGIVVFDGNKGGTHNVFQQLVENKKPFVWINPVSQKIWECF